MFRIKFIWNTKEKIKKALGGRCKTHINKMAKFRKKPVVIEAITFDELVKHGLDNGANVNNGMPWSWNYGGHPITHENDQCYLIPTMEGTMQMTPNEKALELFNKYAFATIYFTDKENGSYRNAKSCAKICVDVILNEYNCLIQTKAHQDYWEQVKKELEKL